MTETRLPQDPAELTPYIETRYLAPYHERLSLLAQMAERVKTAHSGAHNVSEGLSDLSERIIDQLEVHMQKEEQRLFRAIRKGERTGIENPITAMRAGHDDHTTKVDQIHRKTDDLTLPEGACGTWIALCNGLAAFPGALKEHKRLQNDALFPKFEPV